MRNVMRSSKRIKSSSLLSSSSLRDKSSKDLKKQNENMSGSQPDEYEVEAIVACRVVRGRKEYLLKWKGYSESENTWTKENNLHCPQLISAFEKTQKPSIEPTKNQKLEASKQAEISRTHSPRASRAKSSVSLKRKSNAKAISKSKESRSSPRASGKHVNNKSVQEQSVDERHDDNSENTKKDAKQKMVESQAEDQFKSPKLDKIAVEIDTTSKPTPISRKRKLSNSTLADLTADRSALEPSHRTTSVQSPPQQTAKTAITRKSALDLSVSNLSASEPLRASSLSGHRRETPRRAAAYRLNNSHQRSNENENSHTGAASSSSSVSLSRKSKSAAPFGDVTNDERVKSNDLVGDKETMNGFERGLKPEKILELDEKEGHRLFLVKWADSIHNGYVPAHLANQKCPQLVIQFYEENFSKAMSISQSCSIPAKKK